MTNREEMFKVLDYILNRSNPEELEVIRKAIERRMKDLRRGIAGVNIREEIQKTASSIQNQFGNFSELNEMIRKFVRDIIKQQEPDMTEDQLSSLLEEIAPDRSRQRERGEVSSRRTGLPQEVIDSMVIQFVDYSLGRMSPADKAELATDWNRRYWKLLTHIRFD